MKALTINLESDLVGDGLGVGHDWVLGAALQLLADVLHLGGEGQHADSGVAIGSGLQFGEVEDTFSTCNVRTRYFTGFRPSGERFASSYRVSD